VLSIATWVQPWDSNHSRMLSSSRVVVPKVRTCLGTLPSFRTINKQATTVAWCTSIPQPRSTRVSITPPSEAIAAPQVCCRHFRKITILDSSIAFLTSLLLPPDNKKLFCHHRTHQQTIAQERTQIIRSFRGVSQFYCSPCSAGRSSRSGAPARGTGYVVSFAPSAFALGYRSRGRVSFRAHSDFQLHRDQRSRRLRPAGKFSRESSPGIFSRTVRNLAADCVPRALRLLYLVPGRRKYGGISLDRKLDVHSAALDRRYRICLYRLAYLDDAF